MYINTKDKIAETLVQLANDRPIKKITVQMLMETADMKRQSFYYHFRDIQDVVLWMIDRDVIVPLSNSDLPFVEWVFYGFRLLDRKRSFYRKIVPVLPMDYCREKYTKELAPRICRYLYGTDKPELLDEHHQFVVEFYTHSVIKNALFFICSKVEMDENQFTGKVNCLLDTIRTKDITKD